MIHVVLEALHPDRLRRLRKVAKYGHTQKKLSQEFKKHADQADARWWKHAIQGGAVQDISQPQHRDTFGSNDYERKKHARKREIAGMRSRDMDRNAGKASMQFQQARDIVRAYGHPKRTSRKVNKQGLAALKLFKHFDAPKDKQDVLHKALGRRKAELKKLPAASQGRKDRLSRIRDAYLHVSRARADSIIKDTLRNPKHLKFMDKSMRILKRREAQTRSVS